MKNKPIIKRLKACICLWLLFIALVPSVWAQGDCGQNLARAQQLYDEGKLQQIPQFLNKCIKGGFTLEERIKAYRLLTLSYLFTNEQTLADDAFTKLLRLAPDYKVDKENDPATLVHLYQSYRTAPVLSFSLIFGPNQTLIRRSQIHSLGNTNTDGGSYSSKIGFQVGLGANIYLRKNISLQIQASTTSRAFAFDEQLLGYANISYQERQRLLEIPVSLFYHFGRNKLLPYVFAGAKYQYLLSAKADIVRQQDISRNIDVNGLNMMEQRRDQNVELFFGAGCQYRIKRVGLFMQASFGTGIFEQVIGDKRYSINDLAYRYGYVDDDFATDHIGLQAGITYSIYNPKKLKNRKFEELREAEPVANQVE